MNELMLAARPSGGLKGEHRTSKLKRAVAT